MFQMFYFEGGVVKSQMWDIKEQKRGIWMLGVICKKLIILDYVILELLLLWFGVCAFYQVREGISFVRILGFNYLSEVLFKINDLFF